MSISSSSKVGSSHAPRGASPKLLVWCGCFLIMAASFFPQKAYALGPDSWELPGICDLYIDATFNYAAVYAQFVALYPYDFNPYYDIEQWRLFIEKLTDDLREAKRGRCVNALNDLITRTETKIKSLISERQNQMH